MVGAFLRGEEVDFTLDGVMHPITFANTDFGYINLEERIPIPVGGFGPRAQALAGELGDGLMTGLPGAVRFCGRSPMCGVGRNAPGAPLATLRFMRWSICFCSSLRKLLIGTRHSGDRLWYYGERSLLG